MEQCPDKLIYLSEYVYSRNRNYDSLLFAIFKTSRAVFMNDNFFWIC